MPNEDCSVISLLHICLRDRYKMVKKKMLHNLYQSATKQTIARDTMRNFKKITFWFLMAAAISAQGQGMVTSAMGTRAVLKAYADADGKSELTLLNVKDIAFPLKIFEVSETGFIHVKVLNKDVWLDRKQVRIPPESLAVSCLTVDQANANLVTAGIRGANSGCK